MLQRLARITSKGQVTIPRDVRRLLGVQAGDALLFEQGQTGVQVRPVRKASPFEKYRGIGNPGIASGRRAVVKHIRELRSGK